MDTWQVHMVLLPYKKQRKKTSMQKGSLPHFNETFHFSGLHPSELHKLALRFRLYALGGRVLRDRMIGEKVLRLDELQPEGGTTEMTLSLQPRSNLKVTLSVKDVSDLCVQKVDCSPVRSTPSRAPFPAPLPPRRWLMAASLSCCWASPTTPQRGDCLWRSSRAATSRTWPPPGHQVCWRRASA